jgi:dTDP-4-amino-4,6-dideoxygalactose transaminase
MAAIGSTQLERFSAMASKRQELAMAYNTLLDPYKWCRVMPNDYRSVVPHIYVVRLEGMRDRQALRARMLDDGIQTGVHYWPNHWLSLFREGNECELPVTEREFPQLLTLPLHPDLTEEDVEQVVNVLSSQLS